MQTIREVVEWLMSGTRAAALDEDETSNSIPGSGCTNVVEWDFHPMPDLLLTLPLVLCHGLCFSHRELQNLIEPLYSYQQLGRVCLRMEIFSWHREEQCGKGMSRSLDPKLGLT